MVSRLYLDTSIWLDFYEKRGVHGEHAFHLLQRILLEEHLVIVSDVVIRELKGLGYTSDQIEEVFSILKPDHIRKVHITKEQLGEARELVQKRDVPHGDALHAIIARDHEAILISRDKDFQKLKDVTKVALPEDFM